MTFAWPYLLFLLLVPAGWFVWELRHRRSAAAAAHPHIVRAEAGIGRLTLGSGAAPAASGSSRRPRLWLCLGLACGFAALARPQWGRIDEPVFEQSREIVIALDLSRSMLTPDVKPTRLDRAKLLVQSLLDKLAGERVGLVSFAGTAFLQAPLSADYEVLREFLPSLAPGFMPVGGTDYGALIDAASDAFSRGATADRFLIILSDGGATDDDWRQHVAKLKEKGVRVIGLGVGTAAGALIPDAAGGYVKDDSGAVVMSKLESDTLRELSALTGGVYRDASQWLDLSRLLNATVAAGHKGKFTEKSTARFAERFQWALAPALLLLLLSYYREFPVRPKTRDIELAGRDEGPAPPPLGAAAALLLLCLGALGLAPAASAESPPAAPGALLGRIVGRLSAQDSPGALDWLELGRQTYSWGQQLQASGQPVPAGPVQDALAAVAAGSALDRKAADWPQLHDQLETLLKNSEQQKQKQQDQQQKQQKNQDQQQSKQSQQSQSSQPNQGGQKNEQNAQSQQNPSQQSQAQQSQPASSPTQDQGQTQAASPSSRPPSSAFGQMNPPSSPPPSSTGTQQVGGARPEGQDPAKTDPALAPLLQKLEEVKDRDSPAQLFQMFEKNEPRPPDKKGKDW